MTALSPDAIIVGERSRVRLAGIDSLAASINTVGLLQPPVVRPVDDTWVLVAGHRRLEAVRLLGWDVCPVSVAESISDELAALQAEGDENTEREPFTPEEAVRHRRRIEVLVTAQAKERQGARTDLQPSAKLAESPAPHERTTRQRTAKGTGFSGTTLDKAEQVVAAAEAEPEKFAPLVAEMNKTGRVNGAYRKLVVAQKSEAIEAEAPPLPAGPFRVIVADPPWSYGARANDPSHQVANPYPSMSIEDICAMDVASLATDDAVLWLWTTNAHMRQSYDVLDAWGFEPKSILTWAKDRMGTGDWLRGQTEHCHLAVRGRPTVRLTNQSTLLSGQRREHSRKPEEFFDLVEALCPGSKVELFCRTPREGWATHGDEAA